MLPIHSIDNKRLCTFHIDINVLLSENDGKYSQNTHVADRVLYTKNNNNLTYMLQAKSACCNICNMTEFYCKSVENGKRKSCVPLSGRVSLGEREGSTFGVGGESAFGEGEESACLKGMVCMLKGGCLKKGEG